MAKSKAKAAKVGGATAAAAVSPYVQRLIQDAELRDNLRTAYDSVRVAYGRINGKAPAKLLDDKKLQRELQNAATALKGASDSLREGPKKRRRRRGGFGFGKLLFLGVVGTAVALGVSEGLRNKVLDALFGAEEEFDYQSTTVPAPPPPTPAATGS
jgi:hypothetical protein